MVNIATLSPNLDFSLAVNRENPSFQYRAMELHYYQSATQPADPLFKIPLLFKLRSLFSVCAQKGQKTLRPALRKTLWSHLGYAL